MLKETSGNFRNCRAYDMLKPICVIGNPGRKSLQSGTYRNLTRVQTCYIKNLRAVHTVQQPKTILLFHGMGPRVAFIVNAINRSISSGLSSSLDVVSLQGII